MKVFVVLSAIFACALAKPHFYAPVAYTAPVAHVYAAPHEVSSQYHAQDSLGQYSYGYAGGLSAKSESRSVDGVTSGGYSYVDANGELQHVSYTADPVHGFRVAASNLPVAPVAPKAEEVEAPKPVEDTPEVAQAKEEHFAAVEEAKARQAALPETESVEITAPVALPAAVKLATPVVTPVVTPYAAHPVNYYGSYGYSAISPSYHTYTQYAPAVTAYSTYGYAPYTHVANVAPVSYVAPVWDTPEVAKAKAEHFAAVEEAKARIQNAE